MAASPRASPLITVLVPLHPPHGCQLCLPIPRDYSDHAGLVKHLKHVHGTTLAFECRACGLVLNLLKQMKLHQQRSEVCRNSIAAAPPPPPLPADRKKVCIPTRPRKKYSPKKRRKRPTPLTDSDSSPGSPSNDSPPCSTNTRPRRRTRSIMAPSPPEHQDSPSSQLGNSICQNLGTATSSQVRPTTPNTANPSPDTSTARSTNASPPPRDTQMGSLQPRVVLERSDIWSGPSPPPARPAFVPCSFSPLRSTQVNPVASNSRSSPTIPTSVNESQAVVTVPAWITTWVTRFDSALDEDMLEVMLMDLTNLVYNICNVEPIDLNRRYTPSRQPRPDSVAQDASAIQKLYCSNKKRAFAAVTGEGTRYCDIPDETILNHFRSVLGAPPPSPDPPPLPSLDLHTTDNDPLSPLFTPAEVADRLRRGRNTAPGPDGIRYNHWRRLDPSGSILAAVFNAVKRTAHIPYSWRLSTTILAYKKGPYEDISNWRPISLSCTLGKLYTACLANRLLKWCEVNDRLSPAQKGFVHYEGCQDHNYILQSIIQDARRTRRSCHVAWLDLCNAFGSIPHETLWKSLKWIGLHPNSIDTISLLYSGGATRIRSSSGYLEPIPILAGVRQGCPISPILFNIALEVGIRLTNTIDAGYNLHGCKFDVLAYADDVTLISDSQQGLTDQLQLMSSWAKWAGVSFNPKKCASLSVDGKAHTTGNIRYHIQGKHIPILGPDDLYNHLGVPTGFATGWTSPNLANTILQHLDKINASKLAPWQRIDAVNTFLIPRLIFHLSLGTTSKKSMDSIDKAIKRSARKWLNLPLRASPEILYLSHSMGGANLLPCNTLVDVAQVTHAVRLLDSRDANVRATATNTLSAVVRKRIGRDPTTADNCVYLNGTMEGDFGSKPTDIRSMWTRLRAACRRLRKWMPIEWIPGEDSPILTIGGNPVRKSTCSRNLNGLIRLKHLQSLQQKPDQGKVFRATASNWESNHFLKEGKFTHFADWRFIHRARLSVVPLRGHKRFGNTRKNCRRCNYPNETLPHVLCHCPNNLAAVARRHNNILQRLVNATDKGTACVYINQRIPEISRNCRPDLAIINETAKTATIIDVATPFENGEEAFALARAEKISKYSDIADHFRAKGFDTYIDAFIVGALGGYDPANEAVLGRLAIGRNYAKLMKKLMVSDNIRYSREIYINHVTGSSNPPYQPRRPNNVPANRN